MSDKIKECIQVKNANDECLQYDVAYEVVDPNDASRKNSFCIVIKAEDMDVPSSAAEAVSLANIKAAEIKNTWLAAATTTAQPENSVVGDVSL